MEQSTTGRNVDELFMREALVEARRAAGEGEVPVGAVVVRDGEILGRGHNCREGHGNPLAHAEILALSQAAGKIEGWRLLRCTLYVTLEPCAMCAGASINSRIERLVFGALDPKGGFCGSLGDIVRDSRLNHRPKVRGGVLGESCSQVLKDFFASLRQ